MRYPFRRMPAKHQERRSPARRQGSGARRDAAPPPRRAPTDVAELVTLVAVAGWLALFPMLSITSFGDPITAPKQVGLLLVAGAALGAAPWMGLRLPASRVAALALAALAVLSVISWALGVDPRASVLGWYGFRFGLLTFLCIYVLFFAALELAARGRTPHLLAAGLAGLLLVVLFGFFQETKASSYFRLLTAGGRANGGVGSANDFAAYCIIAIAFFPLLAARTSGRRQLLALGVGAGVATFGVTISGSRAGIVTLGGALVLAAAMLAWTQPRNVAVRWAAALGAGAVIAFGLTFVSGWGEQLLSRFTAEAAPLEDAPQNELLFSGAYRLDFWKGAVGTIRSEPLLGEGPDNLSLVFGEHRPAHAAGLEDSYTRNVASAHNLLLDTAIRFGLPALMALIAFIAAVVIPALRRLRARPVEGPFLLAGLAGYGVMVMLNPESLAGTATAWIVLALLATPGRRIALTGRWRPAAAVPAFAAAFALAVLAGVIVTAERAEALGNGHYRRKEYPEALHDYARAADRLPLERQYAFREFLAATAIASNDATDANLRRAIASGDSLLDDFEPRAAELLTIARLRYLLDPADPEVDRLIARGRALQPHSAKWQAVFDGVKKGDRTE